MRSSRLQRFIGSRAAFGHRAHVTEVTSVHPKYLGVSSEPWPSLKDRLHGADVGVTRLPFKVGRLVLLIQDKLALSGAGRHPSCRWLAPPGRMDQRKSRPPPFELAKVRRVLHLAGCDAHSILFIPDLMNRIREEAPGIELSIESYTRDVFKRLVDGSIDLVFFNAETPLPPGTVSTVIFEDRYALVMREKHPAAAKKWTLAEYAKWESVVVALIGDGRSDIDARLAKAGLTRRIGLSTPHFMGCLAAVAATDMITTTSHLVATRYAKDYRLVVRDPPFPEVRFNNTITTSALRMNVPSFVGSAHS